MSGVEIAGGLVGEQDSRRVDQRAGDGDALHLAAGELEGHARGEGLHFDSRRRASGEAAGCRAGKQQRQLDILDHGERVDELERLKDEADFLAPETG